MAKRSRYMQTKHNKKVKQKANSLRRKGWKVKADLPGFDQPNPIGAKQRIPDLQATKKGAEKIIEIETDETMNKDKKQHEAFRRSAAQKPRTSFSIEDA